MTLALVTGASSGIGREIARRLAADGEDLILVARRKDRLEELAAELGDQVQVHVYAADLLKEKERVKLHAWCKKSGLEVDHLVNNAGFGGRGRVGERDWDNESEMIQLNITALTHLTHLFVPELRARNTGGILNVSSTAGFVPGPNMAVYFATKAYVNSFTQSLIAELRGTNVTVTALCPGPIATEFFEVAGAEDVKTFRKRYSAVDTANDAVDGFRKRKDFVISPRKYAHLLRAARGVPRGLVRRVQSRVT